MAGNHDVEVFERLIEQGRAFEIEETKEASGRPTWDNPTTYTTYRRLSSVIYYPWHVDALFAIGQAFGGNSLHWEAFNRMSVRPGAGTVTADKLETAIGVLERARDAIKDGRLLKATDRAVAGAFDDLLDAAQHLHEKGLHLPAASIAGAALEAELKNLYERKIGPWPAGQPTSISKLADPLATLHNAGNLPEYDKTEHKHVGAWGGLRNDADHGNVSNSDALQIVDSTGTAKPNIDPAKVRDMISGVRSFVLKFRGVR